MCKPFTYISLDFAGPVKVKGAVNSRARLKCWIVVYCCRATKAVDLLATCGKKNPRESATVCKTKPLIEERVAVHRLHRLHLVDEEVQAVAVQASDGVAGAVQGGAVQGVAVQGCDVQGGVVQASEEVAGAAHSEAVQGVAMQGGDV